MDYQRKKKLCEAIRLYYVNHITGGNLHIVLDDGNVDTHHVGYCKENCIEKQDTEGLHIANELLEMSYSARLKLYNKHWSTNVPA